MKTWTRLLLPLLFAFGLPSVLLAQSGNDSGVGTWALNVAKSTFKPGPAPQSETRIYEIAPDGTHHLTVHAVSANGTAINETSTYKLDGKPYDFMGSSDIDAVAPTRVDSREIRVNELRQGKIIGHFTRIVSKDGKTMTATSTTQTAAGKTERDVRVYDRQ